MVNETKMNNAPLSAWDYFWYRILFLIPIVGLIFLFIFSFKKNKNINLRNFVPSYFLIYIVLLLIITVLFIFGIGLKIPSEWVR